MRRNNSAWINHKDEQKYISGIILTLWWKKPNLWIKKESCLLKNCCCLLLPVKSKLRVYLFLFLILSFLHSSLSLFLFSGSFQKVSLFLFSDFPFHFWIVLKGFNPLWTFYFFTIQILPKGEKININMWEIINIFKWINLLIIVSFW